MFEPVENDPAELGLYTTKQLQLAEVLIKAVCAPVAGAHAAETDMAAKRQRNGGIHHQSKTTANNTHIKKRDKNLKIYK